MTGPRLLFLAHMAVVVIVVAALLGCSSAGSGLVDNGGLSAAPPMSLMPPIPADASAGHQADVAHANPLNGSDFFLRSPGSTVSGTKLVLHSSTGNIAWGIYEVPTMGGTLTSCSADVTVQSGGPVWLGLSNYTSNSWDFAGPYTPGATMALSAKNASPGGNMFFAIVAYNGTQLTVNSAMVMTDVMMQPVTINMTGGHVFDPQTAHVNAGDMVVFQNTDTIAPHTATMDPLNITPGGPASPTVLPGGSYSWQVPMGAGPGTQWFYHCSFHGLAGDGTHLGTGMAGVIIVN
jgi:plastocyanin